MLAELNEKIERSLSLPLLPLLPLPAPKVALNIRAGVLSDLPFIDRLQKMHTKAVGFMPLPQLEGHIKAGKVLIAVGAGSSRPDGSTDAEGGPNAEGGGTPPLQEPVGYLIAADRYFKHDDVGIIYQMNVLPDRQRGFVAASLLKAQFERSAYGCKLYCCWCAQELAANKFWEAMGFVPLAFRTGGTGTGKKPARMHIFWQKRIREGDETTPWWFPSETSGGAIKENRIVLPIPPGTHWSDAKPLVLPGEIADRGLQIADSGIGGVPAAKRVRVKVAKPEPIKATAIMSGGLRFAPVAPVGGPVEKPKKEDAQRQPKPRMKNDPRLVAAARELRDRWLEQVNQTPLLCCGKYEVSRRLEGNSVPQARLFIEQSAAA
jgi:hypothetical protein